MRFRNVLIVVNDIEKSVLFYKELFGLHVIEDSGDKVIMTEGIVLQQLKVWENFIGKEVVTKSNSCELYFEERNIEEFIQKLEKNEEDIVYVNRLYCCENGRKFVRFYDLDGNLIEVGTAV